MRSIPGINRLAHLRSQAALIVMAALILKFSATVSQSLFKLTYHKPASKWTEALPLGNGRIGAMVFGGTADERLQINESTLWGGSPHEYTNPEAYSQLDEIRRLIFAGKVEEAEKLSETMMGKPNMLMPYQPFCDLRLHFPGHDQATEAVSTSSGCNPLARRSSGSFMAHGQPRCSSTAAKAIVMDSTLHKMSR